MIDTHLRKYTNSAFNKSAQILIDLKMTPNKITILALVIGILASVAFYFDYIYLSVGFLWLSGFLDVTDGQMSRILKSSSDLGALLDIVFDRIVELCFILVLGIKFPEFSFEFMILLASIVLSMTVFLTVGALSQKNSEKAFYYQAGLMERTETFIFFTAMIITPYVKILATIFALGIFFTAGQRIIEAVKLLRKD